MKLHYCKCAKKQLTQKLQQKLQRQFSDVPVLVALVEQLQVLHYSNFAKRVYSAILLNNEVVVEWCCQSGFLTRKYCLSYRNYKYRRGLVIIDDSDLSQAAKPHAWAGLANWLGVEDSVTFFEFIRFTMQLCLPEYKGNWQKNPLASIIKLQKLIAETPGWQSNTLVKHGLFAETIGDRTLRDEKDFWMALYHNDPEKIRKFCLYGLIDPGMDNNKPLFEAVKANLIEIVVALMEDNRVNPAAENNRAYRYAKSSGYRQIERELLRDERVKHEANLLP